MVRRVGAPSRSHEMHGHDDTITGCAEIDRNATPDFFGSLLCAPKRSPVVREAAHIRWAATDACAFGNATRSAIYRLRCSVVSSERCESGQVLR